MMRNLFLSILCGAILLSFSSCGEYQRVLKQKEVKPKYELAVELYNDGLEDDSSKDLKRTLTLLEQILPQYRGKPQGQKIAYIYADAYYQLESYFDSGYQFERFRKAYPKSEKVEEAYYKEAKSYYYVSPRYTLDQIDTKRAIQKLQNYISKFPSGENIGDANEMVGELRGKLAKKKFEIAKLYYDMEDYKAGIEAMTNFTEKFPGSKFQERAYYIKLDAAYTLAVNSYSYLVEERLQEAKGFYDDYHKYYPEGELNKKADALGEKISNKLNIIN
jgi:outer membrane protein assembly factor BamD